MRSLRCLERTPLGRVIGTASSPPVQVGPSVDWEADPRSWCKARRIFGVSGLSTVAAHHCGEDSRASAPAVRRSFPGVRPDALRGLESGTASRRADLDNAFAASEKEMRSTRRLPCDRVCDLTTSRLADALSDRSVRGDGMMLAGSRFAHTMGLRPARMSDYSEKECS